LRLLVVASIVSAVNVQDIRDLYSAAPFNPFEIVLPNGSTVRVDHPEFMSFSPDYRTVHVYEVNGSGKRIDVKMIVALNELKNGARPRKRKR
jgi:hypothetical protein